MAAALHLVAGSVHPCKAASPPRLTFQLVSNLIQARPTCTAYRPAARASCRMLRVAAAASAQTDAAAPPATEWFQKTITLPAKKRGCHVMTYEVISQLPEISNFEIGMANLFLLHTSASLTINENASPDVPLDLNDSLDKLAPEGNFYRHLDEGYDDMPAHVKSSLMGASLDIPISRGRLALGTWQGVYLNEHRDYGGPRSMVVTIQGRKRADGQRYGQYR